MSSSIQNATGPMPDGISPRKETFLARYPRNLKIGVVVVLCAVLAGPWVVKMPFLPFGKENKIQSPAPVANVESGKAMSPNPASDLTSAAALQSHAANIFGGADIINDQDDRSVKMTLAPATGLSEDTAEGGLPRISKDGRRPWEVYARPFNTADKRPRIGIVIVGLGLSRVATDAAISRLPANVTLAFDVQSPVVGAWGARARQDGHETLLILPMEPFDYPRSDPGPHALLSSLPNVDNLARLLWALRQSTGYIGVTTLSGSRFSTDPDKLATVLNTLHDRGLMIFDTRIAPHSAIMDLANTLHVPAVASTMWIDQDLAPEAIDAALERLEKTARLNGHAVGIAASTPVMIDHLQAWTKNLPAHGVALAPISAMVQ